MSFKHHEDSMISLAERIIWIVIVGGISIALWKTGAELKEEQRIKLYFEQTNGVCFYLHRDGTIISNVKLGNNHLLENGPAAQELIKSAGLGAAIKEHGLEDFESLFVDMNRQVFDVRKSDKRLAIPLSWISKDGQPIRFGDLRQCGFDDPYFIDPQSYRTSGAHTAINAYVKLANGEEKSLKSWADSTGWRNPYYGGVDPDSLPDCVELFYGRGQNRIETSRTGREP